jgi:hypothetical protein
MVVRCACRSVFWAEPPLACCPSCDEPALIRSPSESTEEFAERLEAYAHTQAEIRALPETMDFDG